MLITALDVAKYFVTLCDPDAGDNISNLKIQKLLYYAQGFHVALYDEPLFVEEIEAWIHGPVVPKVYREYKDRGCGAIPVDSEFDPEVIPENKKEFLNEVYNVFGQYSAWKLRNMTHEEPPWKNCTQGETISLNSMKDFFSTLLSEK